jgi:23S rRNA pseudouridine2605 synthase
MTSDPEGNSAGGGLNPEENEVAAEVKPKARARKKKVAEVVEAAAPEPASEAAPEEVKAKPAKKKAAAKKAKPAVAEEVAPVETSPVEAMPKKKATKAKKDQGRDLVVDEPGALEVADILPTSPAQAEEQPEEDAVPVEEGPEPKPEAKLERLQKILAKAGISSRRKAEELILGGRVQINGQVVMELGTKADPARDHVRVDGKLLQGPERIRYFVLNKPKGFVTTVSDPEGRPTVMQFFSNEHERLYPVGRLDYLSEGLLLVTNDGELANKLTKASSGVEKTYLVKVAGQPSDEGLDALRSGVVIEKGRGVGSGRVRTAPAQIRQVRQGDNPWYEVIVIEGRNRELRKMFEEIGHHVEKIRRIGYGPLILDLEPGKVRELDAEEVHALRLASEGKLKTRRRRGPAPAQLPTVAGKTVRYKKADGKPGFEPRGKTARPEFQTESKSEFKPEFRAIPKASFKPKPSFQPEAKPGFKPEFRSETRPGARPAFKSEFKSAARSEFKPGFKSGAKPTFGAGSAESRPAQSPARSFGSRPGGKPEFGGRGSFAGKPRRVEPPVTEYILPPRKAGASEPDFEDRPKHQGSGFNPDYKPGFRAGEKPAFRRDAKSGSRPAFRTEGPPKRFGGDKPFKAAPPRANFARPAEDDDFVPKKTPGFRIEPVVDKPREERPRSGGFSRPAPGGKPFPPAAGRPSRGDRPFRPRTDRSDRPGQGRGPVASGDRPFRPRGEFRPGSPSRPPSRPPSGERPTRFTPRSDLPAPRRPKPFGGAEGRTESREDGPREFRPRPGGAPPKKFAGARPGAPKTGPGKTGRDGEPRKKERWRNSFTGKNKGRPKPKPKAE